MNPEVAVTARRGLQEYRRFLRDEAPVLRRIPALFFQQAANRPDRTRPAVDAAARLRGGRESRPWLRWLDNPLNRSACLAALTEHAGRIGRIAFSPAGDRFVSASGRVLVLWETETGVDLAALEGHRGIIRDCAFSADGSRLLSASADRTLRIWDAISRKPLVELRGHTSEVTGCAFSPGGDRVVSSSRDGTVRIWDATSGAELTMLTGHRHVVESCSWSGDGTRILSGSWGELKIWDPEADAAVATLTGHSYLITDCAFSPDGACLASTSLDGTVNLWDPSTGRVRFALQGHTDVVWGCAFSPDGSRLLSGSSDGTLRLWDTSTGAELFVLGAHRSPVTACAFAPDGRTFVSGAADGVKRWEWPQRSDLRLLVERRADTISFSRDGHWIAATTGDAVTVWSGDTGDLVVTLKGHGKGVNSCAFAPDGRRVISASADETLKLWKLPSGGEIGTLIGHRGAVEKVVFSPDGARVLSTSDDFGQLSSDPRGPNLWDPATSTLLGRLNGHKLGPLRQDQVFSPDGTRLLSGSGSQVCILDSATGIQLSTTPAEEEYPSDYAFSPDGARILLVAGKMARICDAEGGEVFQLAGHQNTVHHCSFSGDGSRAFSRDKDGALKIWATETGAEVATLTGDGGAYLEWGATADGSRVVVSFDSSLALCKVPEVGSPETMALHGQRVSWTLSPDAAWVAFGKEDRGLAICETATGREIAWYPLTRYGRPMAWGPDGTSLAVKDESGFRLLRLENVSAGARWVGAWPAEGAALKAGCPFCSQWFDVEAEALGTERPGGCCGRQLHILRNPIRGDWHRVAAAWRTPVAIPWKDDEGGTITAGCPLCQSRIQLTKSQLGQDLNCPQCHESFWVDHRSVSGQPAPVVNPAEELKRQQDRRFDELLREITVHARTGLFDRAEELYSGRRPGQWSGPSRADTRSDHAYGGSSSRQGSKPPAKKPWWKIW